MVSVMEKMDPELVDDSLGNSSRHSNLPWEGENADATDGLFRKQLLRVSFRFFEMRGRIAFSWADEVGVHKTIIARAVVQKVSEWHKEWDDHFMVVYICSNINIANQNCRKLGIP